MPTTGSTSMLGMLRAARAKPASTSAPSMISALEKPSLAKFAASALVLASVTLALSSTMMPPSWALAESACLSASARTFFGRLGFAFGLDFISGGLGFATFGQAELAGHGDAALWQFFLHRVADGDPAALGAGHRALDHDQAALDVGLHHLEIERGDALD